jgi:hypothetical protein
MKLMGLWIMTDNQFRTLLRETADKTTGTAVPAAIDVCANHLVNIAQSKKLDGEGHYIARTTLLTAAESLRKLKG